MKKARQLLQEIKAVSLKPKKQYTLVEGLGNFKKGDRVTINEVKHLDNDVEVHFINESGIQDTFYFDKNDIL